MIDNENKYTQDNIDEIEFDDNQHPEHGWNQLAPSNEESRAQSLAEGSEPMTEVCEQDLTDNADIMAPSSSRAGLSVRFESAANGHKIPADEYRKLFRGLNAKQKDIVMFHRNWCKGASALALQSNPDWIASALYYRVPQKPTECVMRYVVISSRGCIRKRSLIETENKHPQAR